MITKQISILLTAAFSVVSWLAAGPLVKSDVAKEAKWLAHIDLDGVMRSSFGDQVAEKIKEGVAKSEHQVVSVDVDQILAEIKSVTAYGTSYGEDAAQDSVIVLKSGDRMQAIFDAFLAAYESEADDSPIERLGEEPYRTFLLENELYLSFPNKNYAIASKSPGAIDRAFEVILGNAESLAEGDSELVTDASQEFFFTASARGLDALKDVPPQARMLQKATGGQFAFGEREGVINARMTLTTPGPSVSKQLARIVEGLIALVSFAEVQDENLLLLTQNTVVSSGDKYVAVNMSYPTEAFSGFVEEMMTTKKDQSSSQRKSAEDERYEVFVEDGIGGEQLGIRNVDASDDHNGHIAFHAIDGDFETDWVANGRRHWIRFMLESPSLVKELQIAVRKGDVWQAKFAVQRSVDGVDWEDVIYRRSSGKSAGIESINIPDTGTSWIRLRCMGSSKGAANALTEVRWIGVPNYLGEKPAE